MNLKLFYNFQILKILTQNSQAIRGAIKFDLNMVRTVNGLNLKVGCYLVDGNYVGSCVYNDFCQFIKWRQNFSPENCPDFLLNNGIDCTCPSNLSAGIIDIDAIFDLPDFSTTKPSWLGSGDFSVDLKLAQGTTSILCLNIKFSTKPK